MSERGICQCKCGGKHCASNRRDSAEVQRAAARDARERNKAATADTVTNSYKQWTGPELELLLRRDLTAKQLALMLGRSWDSVKTMRRKVNSEPKYMVVAGSAGR